MELRLLEYFLAVAREQNITAAAKALHISQPALSTQLKNMEAELGKKLLIRGVKGSRKVILTEEGMILRKRAEEMLLLMRRTEEEITGFDETIAGNVFIGTGETEIVRLFAKASKKLQQKYPDIRYNISSGNAEYVLEQKLFGKGKDKQAEIQYSCGFAARWLSIRYLSFRQSRG